MKIKLSDPQQRLVDLMKIDNLKLFHSNMIGVDTFRLETIDTGKNIINSLNISTRTFKSLVKLGILEVYERNRNYTTEYRISENCLKSINNEQKAI